MAPLKGKSCRPCPGQRSASDPAEKKPHTGSCIQGTTVCSEEGNKGHCISAPLKRQPKQGSSPPPPPPPCTGPTTTDWAEKGRHLLARYKLGPIQVVDKEVTPSEGCQYSLQGLIGRLPTAPSRLWKLAASVEPQHKVASSTIRVSKITTLCIVRFSWKLSK